MRQTAKIAIMTILAVMLMTPAAQAATLDANQRALLRMINTKRIEKGVKPLKWGFRIERAAERHSVDMATKAYMAHRSPSGATLTRRLKHSGISRWTRAAENITTAASERAAYNRWLGNSSNRRKMLDARYTHIGIGVTEGGDKGNVYTLNLVQNPRLKKGIPAAAKNILNLVNAERSKVGASPLKWGYALAKAGQLHSRDMMDHRYFSHTSQDGRGVTGRLAEVGIKGWWSAGENIAGAGSSTRAFEQWMNSNGHRRNMLNPSFTHVGIGIATDGAFSIFTMDLVEYRAR